MHRGLLFSTVILLVWGCDDNTAVTNPDSGRHDSQASDSSVKSDAAPADGESQKDTSVTDGETPALDVTEPDAVQDASIDCVQKISSLASALSPSAESCTVVVRFDYQTLTLLGYQSICGAYTGITEANARSAAQTSTGYGAAGTMLNGANPEDEFVFYEAPGDFGGAAAVSARTGLPVFGGSIIWMGSGEITYPKSWLPVSDLGYGCQSTQPVNNKSKGYDLRGGTTLPQADVDKVISELKKTVLLDAISKNSYLFDTVVVLYPRSVGAFDPNTAEWIAFVNSGWLE